MSKPRRYLTKSRFVMAISECPTKLYYTGNKYYQDNKIDDEFLKALASGGFQVGELAKYYYPGGIDIDEYTNQFDSTKKIEEGIKKTNELLKKENVTIYEATIAYENLLVKVDVLQKIGNQINLIEVKSKSFNPLNFKRDVLKDKEAKDKKNWWKIHSDWKKYVYDVAFQTYVVEKALSYKEENYSITPYLMCADKTKCSSVSGLNQIFRLKEENGRTICISQKGITKDKLGDEVLTAIEIQDIVDKIRKGLDQNEEYAFLKNLDTPDFAREENSQKIQQFRRDGKPRQENGEDVFHYIGEQNNNFEKAIKYFSKMYEENSKIPTIIGSTKCRHCNFKSNSELKCGFTECWQKATKLEGEELKGPFVFDIWDNKAAGNWIKENGPLLLKHVQFLHLDANEVINDKEKLSRKDRQWLQVLKYKNKDNTPFYASTPLATQLKEFINEPMHMIDFETSMVAIPFHKGRKPYEQIAFQFSHHILHPCGKIEHANQYICKEVGMFPNFDFAYNLMKSLKDTNGVIFRYSNHENTVLRQIFFQLCDLTESEYKEHTSRFECDFKYEHKEDVLKFIKSITKYKVKKSEKPNLSEAAKKYLDKLKVNPIETKKHIEYWEGERNMVDLCQLVKEFYYHPEMKGSNSIKYVLPAILNESSYLQKKYEKEIYGKTIKSLNFKTPKAWITKSNGIVENPYDKLGSIFNEDKFNKLDWNKDDSDSESDKASINNGGAAMMAYAKAQFTEMNNDEREKIFNALLRYCELDTLAMVFIVEHWIDKLRNENYLAIGYKKAS